MYLGLQTTVKVGKVPYVPEVKTSSAEFVSRVEVLKLRPQNFRLLHVPKLRNRPSPPPSVILHEDYIKWRFVLL